MKDKSSSETSCNGTQEDTGGVTARFVRIPSIAERKLGRDYSAPIRLDPRALDQMQKTIRTLAAAYADALGTQIASLLPLIEAGSAGLGDARNRLYSVAHDIRGLAGTFGMPTVGRFAQSLCNYMETCAELDGTIVRFHVEAMRDAVNDPATDPNVANETLRSLERLIAATRTDSRTVG